MPTLQSRPLFHLTLDLLPAQDVGATPAGQRRMIPIEGGRFEGERLSGVVLPRSGADMLLMRHDGAAQQDVRVTLKADDGGLILMTYRGVRRASPEVAARLAAGEAVSPDEYYMRITPFFETAAGPHAWLNTIVAIGLGERRPTQAIYDLFEIL